MLITPALKKWKLQNQEFEARLGYMRPCLKKNKDRKNYSWSNRELKSIKCWFFSGTPVSLSLPRLGNHWGAGKSMRAWDSGWPQGNGLPGTAGQLCVRNHSHVAACTGLTETQRGEGRRHDAPLLAEELLVAGDSWEESQFSLKTLLLGGRPCSIGRPHIQESVGSTACTWWV